jgi:hypothetical protein
MKTFSSLRNKRKTKNINAPSVSKKDILKPFVLKRKKENNLFLNTENILRMIQKKGFINLLIEEHLIKL